MRYRAVKCYARHKDPNQPGGLIFATLEVEGEPITYPYDLDQSRIGSREHSAWVEADYHPLLAHRQPIVVD